MANSANRLFSIMQKAGTDTISEVITLTVKQINPFVFTDEDKLIIPNDLLVFSRFINKDLIRVGDKFLAQSFNNAQIYYISDIISSTNEADIYMIKINELINRVGVLESNVRSLDTRVTALEGRMTSLEARVTALENK